MLPDIGAGELLLIGIVALVVVGPKDLPMLMRRLGQFTARLRGMAAEFRASFDEMGRQSELDELRREVEALRSGKVLDEELGRTDAQSVMREIETGLSNGGMQVHPPMGNPYAGSQSLSDPEPAAPTPEAPKPAPPSEPSAAKTAVAKPAKAKAEPSSAAAPKAPRKAASSSTAKATTPKAPAKPRASRAKPAGDKA
ncbi:Sec-independent protein translocase protein TatB [Phenylobacterium sp.]|uniref:Sec-independent protein translocase protein TatB n=1 Tax=Phenylobacterium sp. TaxID=1871053 RepID=UPI0027310DBC|nr:Sec-independent protein translocase protein TatB [Phenylobacterium sp.]MDP1618626.1 Sec-independent protein translocase protein TatB [Phenylobacterium sp.]MDP1985641.1 Sec-independent protein translocase protein TatB [Phenylobacterium sp.]